MTLLSKNNKSFNNKSFRQVIILYVNVNRTLLSMAFRMAADFNNSMQNWISLRANQLVWKLRLICWDSASTYVFRPSLNRSDVIRSSWSLKYLLFDRRTRLSKSNMARFSVIINAGLFLGVIMIEFKLGRGSWMLIRCLFSVSRTDVLLKIHIQNGN